MVVDRRRRPPLGRLQEESATYADVWGFADTQKVTADLSCCLKGLMASLIAKEPKSP